jgi:hypothetical protein
MLNTYKPGEEDPDRDGQRELLAALNALALQRDECGAWRINGSGGHVYTWGDGSGHVLYVRTHSSMAWTYAKKRLAFCKVTQNGDEEGCLRLLGLPIPEQATVIREVLGIRKRRPPSSIPAGWSKTRAAERASAQILASEPPRYAREIPAEGNFAPESGVRLEAVPGPSATG